MAMVTHLGSVNLMQISINPVPRTYVRGIEAFPLQGSQNIHPRAHARGVLWYGVNAMARIFSVRSVSALLLSGCIKVGPDFKKPATSRSCGGHNRAGHDPLASGRLLDRSGRDHHGGTHLRNRPHHGTSAGALLDPLPDSVADAVPWELVQCGRTPCRVLSPAPAKSS